MLTKEEDCIMNLLKINDKHKGFYQIDGKWTSIASIEADDLVALIEMVAKNEEAITLDECNGSNPISNPIEKTIYEEVYKVLKDLAINREAYLAECEDKISKLEEEYGLEKLPSTENSSS